MADSDTTDPRSALRAFWDNTLRFNLVMFGLAAVLSMWMIRSAFSDQFRCDYLIVDKVSAPEFMCTGADLGEATGVASVVDDVGDFLGLGEDDSGSVVGDALTIPGLASLIDGPLTVVRRIGVIAGLLLLVAFSALATWILRHLQHVVRLLRFDRQAWRQTAATARTFISIFMAVLVPVWLLAVF